MNSTQMLPKGSKVLIVCDAIGPDLQLPKTKHGVFINGVCSLVRNVIAELGDEYVFFVLHPFLSSRNNYLFPRIPYPRIPQFQVALADPIKIWKMLKDFRPDGIVITTVEGTLGRTTKLLCHFPGSLFTQNRKKIPYVIIYTTHLDQYAALYLRHHTNGLLNISSRLMNPIWKRFYIGADKVLVPTFRAQKKLHQMGVHNTVLLPRGVDTKLFRPRREREKNLYCDYDWYRKSPLQIYLYFGRISLVKGIEDFLFIDTPNVHKVVIGEGPYMHVLQNKFHDANLHFLGAMYGEALARHVRFSDLVFFPSKTDTWGQVITEAGASGVPVIAYDVPGSGEVIIPGITGIRVNPKKSLSTGITAASTIDRRLCAMETKKRYRWKKTARILVENISLIHWKE